MGLTIAIITLCLALGAVAAVAGRRPGLLDRIVPSIGAGLREARPKQFSPKRTLFLIGPAANHPACRLQRRLLKQAIPAFIRDDITIIEIYGDDRPRKNGEEIDWLDTALLRHAMNAEEGFFLIYVDAEGKTALRSEAPVVTADILERARLAINHRGAERAKKPSAVLRRLRAA